MSSSSSAKNDSCVMLLHFCDTVQILTDSRCPGRQNEPKHTSKDDRNGDGHIEKRTQTSRNEENDRISGISNSSFIQLNACCKQQADGGSCDTRNEDFEDRDSPKTSPIRQDPKC